jgi:hypothetical protein
MIISEKQIMHLIRICNEYSIILSSNPLDISAIQFNKIRDLLDLIGNQQSNELKVME